MCSLQNPAGSGEPRAVRRHRPEELDIETIERFEGISNPDDQTIVLALHCRTHGCRGTDVAPYGKDMPSIDASFIRRDARRAEALTSL